MRMLVTQAYSFLLAMLAVIVAEVMLVTVLKFVIKTKGTSAVFWDYVGG